MPNLGPVFGPLDISSRPKRRRAVSFIISELERIRSAEETYMKRIPENMHGGDAYAAADDSVDSLADAVSSLLDAY
jgi:hypothetical protein